MSFGFPVVVVATASPYEQLFVERALEKTGRILCSVKYAAAAELVCAECGGAPILVIDAGLLESHRTAEWRELRGRHPELAVVVRSLVSRNEIQQADHNTLLVHPSNGDGLCEALDLLDSYGVTESRAS